MNAASHRVHPGEGEKGSKGAANCLGRLRIRPTCVRQCNHARAEVKFQTFKEKKSNEVHIQFSAC